MAPDEHDRDDPGYDEHSGDDHHGHGIQHGDHVHDEDHPSPRPPDFTFWSNPLLPQGLGLAGLALAALWLIVKVAKASVLLVALLGPVLAVVSVLAAWASAIHLTGGEKFDDHPWV